MVKIEMGLRITTWNVNGIRNPFSHPPWREKRTFEAMFEILEADIVIFQETKIQRKDLQDDMVLVPGWDCFFSLPKHKKGYSGVVVYTRQSVCCPVRAEEGITGILCPPNSSTSFFDLPEEQRIGGYPTLAQARDALEFSNLATDFAVIDSEGRCVILEFPAFVLIGVYCPAARDESRNVFRLGFLNLLDIRVRNLVAIGKRVLMAGDINISRDGMDTSHMEIAMRQNNMTAEQYISAPSRRLFNQLMEGGTVYGERDEWRAYPVLWDICRGFHPSRMGLFTCWEQKVNARPANFGSRIDYVLCSLDIKEWFSDSNIQEGLQGSDHCPVYAIMKEVVALDGKEVHILDIVNPVSMFNKGQRLREYSSKDVLALSGRLIPEFDRRQNIRDMFSRKSSNPELPSTANVAMRLSMGSPTIQETFTISSPDLSDTNKDPSRPLGLAADIEVSKTQSDMSTNSKRPMSDNSTNKTSKRTKAGSATAPLTQGKGQQSLTGFFKPKNSTSKGIPQTIQRPPDLTQSSTALSPTSATTEQRGDSDVSGEKQDNTATQSLSVSVPQSSISSNSYSVDDQEEIHDPIQAKESWSKLFTKPAAPRCEGHSEPCTSLLTKKSGINCGRSFWICARPIGPSGAKERGTEWRCQTFIWCSDWNPGMA